MINFIKKLFASTSTIDYKVLVKNGAQIIDVRTPTEYRSGNIKNSANIPLDTLSNCLSQLNKAKPIITCCASGMRSASAKNMLTSNGFTEVYNGGAWASLQNKLA